MMVTRSASSKTPVRETSRDHPGQAAQPAAAFALGVLRLHLKAAYNVQPHGCISNQGHRLKQHMQLFTFDDVAEEDEFSGGPSSSSPVPVDVGPP